MGFRRLLLGLVILCWTLLAWMVGHESDYPVHLGRYSSEFALLLVGMLLATLQLTAALYFAYRRSGPLRSFRLLAPMLLMLCSAIFSLAFIEVVIRSLDVFGASFFEEVTTYILELEADEQLVFKHRRDFRTRYQGVPFITNELRLRERPLVELNHPGTRVLFLGDSVTLGWGVAAEEAFPRQVELRYRKRWGQSLVSINSGVAGYNTVQEYAFLERHGDELKPDVLVLVYVDNDIDEENIDLADMRRKWDSPPGASEILLRWSWFYRVIYYIAPYVVMTPTVDKDAIGWKNSMDALSGIAAYASARDIPFVTFVYRGVPSPLTDILVAEISALAEREKFVVIDLLPSLEGINPREVTNSFVDPHPNARGHGIIADRVLEFLTSKRWIVW